MNLRFMALTEKLDDAGTVYHWVQGRNGDGHTYFDLVVPDLGAVEACVEIRADGSWKCTKCTDPNSFIVDEEFENMAHHYGIADQPDGRVSMTETALRKLIVDLRSGKS